VFRQPCTSSSPTSQRSSDNAAGARIPEGANPKTSVLDERRQTPAYRFRRHNLQGSVTHPEEPAAVEHHHGRLFLFLAMIGGWRVPLRRCAADAPAIPLAEARTRLRSRPHLRKTRCNTGGRHWPSIDSRVSADFCRKDRNYACLDSLRIENVQRSNQFLRRIAK
jgi:hypothetical protein